jgi:hypothetical protein
MLHFLIQITLVVSISVSIGSITLYYCIVLLDFEDGYFETKKELLLSIIPFYAYRNTIWPTTKSYFQNFIHQFKKLR